MTRKHAWSPTEGPGAAPQQLLPCSAHVSGDGDEERLHGGLWAPSEGPLRRDPGGPGGEPDGHTISKGGRTALDEDEGD